MALNAYPINGILINELNRHIGAKKNVTDENVFLSNIKRSKPFKAKQIKTIPEMQISIFDSRLMMSKKSLINEEYFLSL